VCLCYLLAAEPREQARIADSVLCVLWKGTRLLGPVPLIKRCLRGDECPLCGHNTYYPPVRQLLKLTFPMGWGWAAGGLKR
jgi:hypothetical protein